MGRRIGLVLGGGGARGFSHVGVLKVLEEYRVPVHCVVGTSSGAVVGAVYAAGISLAQLEREIAQVGWRWLWRMLDMAAPGPGLLKGVKLERYLDGMLGGRTFAGMRLPLAVTATDLENGRGVALQAGPVARAVRASAALPGIFAPVEMAGMRLVDGGLISTLPVEVAFKMGADAVIAVDVSQAGENAAGVEKLGRWLPDRGLGRAALPSVIRRCREIVRENRQSTGYFPAERVITIRPEMGDLKWYQFHRSRESLAGGEAAAREAWDRIRQWLDPVAPSVRYI